MSVRQYGKIIASSSVQLINVTYAQLKTLRDGGNLIPGQQYRITDFVTIINGNVTVSGVTKTLYRSAGHQFDIIVTADSSNTLNENARAIQHAGDTYFASQNLKAWKLKYCLDNDTTRFNWASSSGKGVIYYMKDERDNECGYDFKNIQMKRFKITAVDLTSLDWAGLGNLNTKYKTNCIDYLMDSGQLYQGTIKASDLLPIRNDIITINESDFKWCYTFNLTTDNYATCQDQTITGGARLNYIGRTYYNRLNNIVFLGTNSNSTQNHIEEECFDNTFGNNSYRNHCRKYFINNICGPGFTHNISEVNCNNNIFIQGFGSNHLEIGNHNNIFLHSSICSVYGAGVNNCILSMDNAFIGNGVSYVQSGENCDDWNIGNECNHIITGDQCERLYTVATCQYLNITTNNAKVLITTQGTASALISVPNFNNQTMVGDIYGTTTINASTGALGTTTKFYESHRGTVIAADVGKAPTNLALGYTLETYETAS